MIPTPQTDNMIMALKCVPKYAKSPTYDYDRAIQKLREMEKESSEWQATCIEYKRQAKEAFEYELKSKRDAKCPNCQQSYCCAMTREQLCAEVQRLKAELLLKPC